MTAPEPFLDPTRPPAGRVLLAFMIIYVVWGSTYLVIKWAVETLPPFLMGGARFMAAGLILYGWARLRGIARPSLEHWKAATIIGASLLLGGNGCVAWAASRLPSGVSSLLVATTPFWIVGFEWMRRGGVRPALQVLVGLAIGFVGLALLVDPAQMSGGGGVDPLGAVVVLLGTLFWAAGSIYSRSAPLPSSWVLAGGMQQLAGGALLLLAALVSGEVASFDVSAVSQRSALSFLYLVVIGSFVAFTAYIWLLKASTPARVATYAYVNPVVAVFLGWALGGERPTPRMGLAAAVIVLAVVVITTGRVRVPAREPAGKPS
ncbi:MAG TPA: EamA family transporter [Planctomycetota bacterium]|nr:EamA family transporter [Planctomycetota bacterium]